MDWDTVLLVAAAIGAIGVVQYRRHQCPVCGRGWALRQTNATREESMPMRVAEEWKCRYCGFSDWKERSRGWG